MNAFKSIFRLLLGSRLPVTEGTVTVTGLKRPVVIRRDGYGISYIEAENDADAWFGLGFCHGQDRAFQLESQLRAARGTIAEMAGAAALPVDRLSRRIGFMHAAEQQWEVLDEDIRQVCTAYAEGVNQAIQASRRPAHEFTLLQSRPTPYRPVDVLCLLELMSFNLSTNWDCELMRLKILTEDGADALAALDPKYPEWQAATTSPATPAGLAIDRLAEDVAIFKATAGQGGGSNNWTIAPSRTATGRPILANDPHIGAVLPSYFYLAHVRTPEWVVAGASFVGTPAFTSGHNGVAAWGMTNGMTDNTDLFIEEIGTDGRSVRQGDQFIPCEIRKEIIQVKGGTPVEEDVLITPRGPIISPPLEGEFGALSLCATWLKARPARGLFQFHRVRSFDEFRQACEQWPGIPLNLAYADASGAIGWQLLGEAPKRRKGWGTIPLPGWDPEVGWEEEPVPFDEIPHLLNPEAGYVATANAKPTVDDAGPFLTTDWVDGYRMVSINKALESRHDWSVSSVQALQLDQTSLPWVEMRDIILDIPPKSEAVRQALALLREWNGIIAEDSPAASVYELFFVEIVQRIARAKAPKAAQWAAGMGCTPLMPRTFMALRRAGYLVRILREQPAGWFSHPWSAELADALETAVKILRERYGVDPSRWAWGHIRPLTLRHPFGEKAPLDRIFNLGPFPWGGDGYTIALGCVDPLEPLANPLWIPCLRMVIDVGNWHESKFAIPGGQSGNPLSPHYDDQLPFWRNGNGISIAWSPEQVKEATRSVLHLSST